jgi:hypothetical protein
MASMAPVPVFTSKHMGCNGECDGLADRIASPNVDPFVSELTQTTQRRTSYIYSSLNLVALLSD